MRKNTTKNTDNTSEVDPQTTAEITAKENKEVKKTRKPRAKKTKEPVADTTNEQAEAVTANEQETVKKPAAKKARNPQKGKQTETSLPEIKQEEPKEVHMQEAPAEPVTEKKAIVEERKQEPQALKIPNLPNITIHDIVELAQAPQRAIILTDQQIQQLTLEEIEKRYNFLEETLARVLDYDVVISDTNIWLELLIGHTSSHSDPRVNARLQFERQLEFISKLTKHQGRRFMMMGETYEEIDRFASMQDPSNHKDADFTDNIVCLNTAARLAKRLILAQQRENRLRIEGIGAESHHASFADPAIIKKVAELFAEGKKVLLLTNDASVAIRSMGICDDLQRNNNISDDVWNENYASIRPMVFTFDDLRLLDYYTRQYYYIQMAAGKAWMENVEKQDSRKDLEVLVLNEDAFRPGDKHRGDNLFTEQEKDKQPQNTSQKQNQQKQNQQKQKPQQQQKQKSQQQKQEQKQKNEPVKTNEQQVHEAAVADPKTEEVANPVETAAATTPKQEQKAKQKSRRRPQRSKQQKSAGDAAPQPSEA